MHVRGTLVPIPGRQASIWSMESLEQGSRLSREVAARIDLSQLQAYAIVPQGGVGAYVADFTQSARLGDADRVLGGILQGVATISDGILVVDDDLARRGDPGLDGVTFVDDRVVRWKCLRSSPGDLTRLVRNGASGYPLNAFICSGEEGQVLRPQAGSLSETDITQLVGDVRAIIHSIFDAESFLLLVFDENVNSILKSLALKMVSGEV